MSAEKIVLEAVEQAQAVLAGYFEPGERAKVGSSLQNEQQPNGSCSTTVWMFDEVSWLRASEMISVALTEFYRQLTKLTKVRLRRSRRGIALAIPAQSSVSYGIFRACFSDSSSTTLLATGDDGAIDFIYRTTALA